MVWLNKRAVWLVGGLSVTAVALYVLVAAQMSQPGFPLDDAWIHQTYARSLGVNGRWEYVPGAVSSGSTSPLWTVLLAIGYLLGVPYFGWAFALGAVSLWLLSLGGMRLWPAMWPSLAKWRWLVGVTLVLMWPFVWAAASGMETLLFAAMGVWLVADVLTAVHTQSFNHKRAALLGGMAGLLILLRPDGLILVILVAMALLLLPEGWRNGVWLVSLFVGTAVFVLSPYFAFNYATSGTLWPNTFYAKQTEYAVLLTQPLFGRLLRLLYFSLGGPESGWQGSSSAHLLLLPGVVWAAWLAFQQDWRQKRLFYLLPFAWAGGHVLAYAWRLPVLYQHGRYLLAAVPVWVITGLAGWLLLLARLKADGLPGRVLRLVSGITFGIVLIFFLGVGAVAYGRDVAFINGEMVAVAQWLAENTPEDAVIAAHDIGAIGYFGERPLLDLAGLISPEIVPLLADEQALAVYIWQSDADYLVTAPGWPYESITLDSRAELLFETRYRQTREEGVNNMAVYGLKRP